MPMQNQSIKMQIVRRCIELIVVLLCQTIIAPALSLSGVSPNFFFIYTFLLAATQADSSHVLVAFFAGLLFDVFGSGVIGSAAFILCLMCALYSICTKLLGGDVFFMSLVLACVGVLVSELLYGGFLLSFNVVDSAFEVFMLRALPCALYDIVIMIIAFFCIQFFMQRRARRDF